MEMLDGLHAKLGSWPLLSVGAAGLLGLALRRTSSQCIPTTENKAVFITGCDSGFGFSMALHCRCEMGMTVFAGCHMVHGSDGAKALREAGCVVIEHFSVAEVASIEEARDVVDRWLKDKPDVQLWAVVNNAAVLVFGEAEWQTPRQIQAQLQVNIAGPLLMAKAFLPLLRKSRGRIINMTSNSASLPVPTFSVYSGTKAALEVIFETMRLELDKFGVNVVMLNPGNRPTDTPLCARQREYHLQMASAMRPENEGVFGEYFRKCSQVICNLFPIPQLNKHKDEKFYKIFQQALTEERPNRRYFNGTPYEKLVNFLMPFAPVWYKERLQTKMVPLPPWPTNNNQYSKAD